MTRLCRGAGYSAGNACGSGARRAVLFGVLSAMASSGCGEELPVVARGRYVEIATDRDDPVCAGTVAHLDRFIDEVFDILGETPPDRVFVRSEWLPRYAGSAFARLEGDHVVLRSPILVDEHELVHAVHLQAWPRSARFLEEGLAVLIQPHRPYQAMGMSHFSRAGLDELLGAETLEPGRYAAAWFIVSQIVHDHGFEGLRELWLRIPWDSSTQQVRDAYLELHGRPVDELIEPWLYDGPDGPTPIGRQICSYTVCAGEPHGWVEDRWVGSAPVGCEDDPNAVGSDPPPFNYGSYGHAAGSVWRDYVLESTAPVLPPRFSEGVNALVIPCGFRCPWSRPAYFGPESPHSSSHFSGGARVEVRTSLDALPSDPPGTLELQHDPAYGG